MKNTLLTFRKMLCRGLGIALIWGAFSLQSALAQVSVTATAGTTGPTSYTTVNDALAAITAGTHQGDVNILITASTIEPVYNVANQLVASGTGSASYTSLTIKPQGNVVVQSAATPTGGRGILEFIGADSITIDGDDPLTPGTRNLTFMVNTTTNTYTSALRFSSSATTAGSGCRGVTIKNCILIGGRSTSVATTAGTFCITASGQTNGAITSLTTQSADNDNWLIENNEFKRAYTGLHLYGHATNTMDSLVIRNNKFGNDTSALNMGLAGIYVGYTATSVNTGSVLIEGNEVQGGDYTTGWGATISGINLQAGNAGATIRNNYIHDIAQPSTGGWGSYGVFIASATNATGISIYNNTIKDISAFHYTSTASTFVNYGIYCAVAATNLRITHNTIVLNKPNSGSGVNFSSCVYLSNASMTIAEFVNNILVNNQSDGSGQACMNVYLNVATVFSSAATVNRNSYWVSGPSGYPGRIGTVDYATLTAFKAVTLKDTNSFVTNPPFVSIATDLHLQTGAKSRLESNGAVTSITTDMYGNARPGPAGSIHGGASAPDIGAHEADMLPDLFSADSTDAMQIVQTIAPGDTSKAIMHLQVYVSGSIGTPPTLNSLLFNTAGTTAATDITAAKVFYTGSGTTFNTNTLFGSSISPSGSFAVTGSIGLAEGVHNFWLAYDISSGATSGNSADARYDSASVNSIYLVPTNGNPTGSVLINNPMTYVSSTTTQTTLSKVGQGTTNNMILGVEVVTSAIGAPISMNSFDLNLNGTTDTADIQNIKVWYTGTSNVFTANTQFGSTVTYAPATTSPFALTVTGSQTLSNGTNYFWVTYDVKSTAVLTNVIDAECTGISVAGSGQIPTLTSPTGSRQIRANYCIPAHAGTNFVTSLVFNNINVTPVAPVTPWYRLFPQSGTSTTTLVRGNNYNLTIAYNGSTIGSVWIDFDDDGTFAPTEWVQLGTAATSGTWSIPIPCSAVLGDIRMRIRTRGTGNPNGSGDACTTFGGGECMDYIVTILDNPVSYGSATTVQTTGIASPGVMDQPILRVPVKTSGCAAGIVTEMRFSNTSTAAADITAAKLYRTVGNTFNTSLQVGTTIASPSGQFTFMVTDTVVSNDTTNYWLAYDISSTATLSNVADASFDSLMFMGSYYVPTVSNPAGNVQIISPMTYVSSTTTQSLVTKVDLTSVNNPIIGVEVVTSAIGSPIQLTEFMLNLGGTTDTADIQNIKVWYTGTSNTFAATTQFGSTLSYAPATSTPFGFTITGSQTLSNGTNYFWVTYDIKSTATLTNVVDGECTGFTLAGVPQVPSVTAPTGSRAIKQPYCAATYANGCGTDYIARVRLKTLDNTTVCTGSTFYNSVMVPTIQRGITDTIILNYATDPNQYGRAWIDYNDDGDFDDAGEDLGIQSPANAGASGQSIIVFTVPCDATIGQLRLRIRGGDDSQPLATQACGASGSGWGENEDYLVNVIGNPLVFKEVGAIQQTGFVAPGTIDKEVLHLPVQFDGCGLAVLTEVKLSTTGTTSASDITNAKLYRTIGNTFNTSDLRATVVSPSGQFTFMVTDTLVTNDTVNYWLAYDVNASSTLTNILDAKLDSININSIYYLPVNGNPTGNVQINAPMTYVSSTTTQANVSKVETGTTNQQIIGIEVVTSAIGSSINLTNIDLNLNGTTDTLDIQNIKVWYTGNSSAFATTTQFGSTLANAPATSSPFALSVGGTQALVNGNNYFWVTYDVRSTATLSNFVDGECTSITVASTVQTPSVTAPTGNRQIRAPYCASGATSTIDSDIGTLTLACGNDVIMNVSNGCGLTITNGNGTYTNNTAMTGIQVAKGDVVKLSMCYGSGSAFDYDGYAALYIDFNENGVWEPGEMVWASPNAFGDNGNYNVTGTFVIPMTALETTTRMRAVFYEGAGAPLTITNACGTFTYGETEDYTITILPAPAPTTYVWNATTAAAYGTATNWSPNRQRRNITHSLMFNSGTSSSVTGVEEDMVSTIIVDSNTSVTLANANTTEIAAIDNLNLNNGKIITSGNVSVVVGRDTTQIGAITGAGTVEGSLSRWVNGTTPTYSFPLAKGADSRAAAIAYTTAPSMSGKLNVTYIQGNPGKLGLPLTDASITIDSISKDGVWSASAMAGLTGGTFNITINANNLPGVTNFATTTLLGRLNGSSPWVATGTYAATTGSNTAMVLSRTGLALYGQVGIGGDASNPLPVTLTTFTANAQGKDVLVSWTTASEVNNHGFEVQRSVDGRSFETVAFVKGAGNSSRTLNYNSTDVRAFAKANVLYYRLKQVDFNGKFAYSNTVRVSSNNQLINGVAVAPNPFTTDFAVSFNASAAGTVKVELVDIQGRLVSTQSFEAIAGDNKVTFDQTNAINAGVYFVKVYLNGETQVMKLVKN